jgi:hypothetical protein
MPQGGSLLFIDPHETHVVDVNVDVRFIGKMVGKMFRIPDTTSESHLIL